MAHGVDKFFFTGIADTAAQFGQWGIAQPTLSAYVCAVAEMVGGAFLVIGLLTTAVAGALALLMVAATYFVHLPHGLFNAAGGMEYPVVLIAGLSMIVVFGSGRASVDGVLAHVEP